MALPPAVTKLCDFHQGMILVTGSTGTGKSTTLAAMIDHLNQTRRLNIISLEDPIEFVHRSKNSQVIQRELGTHIPSFAEGVRAAMREDPDVILVGELRDAETITMAMTAAETGHLVLGTLHTTSAVKTIDRIIDALPVEEREQTKSFLSQSLLAVVTQVLVKTVDGRGRKAICEVLMMTKAIAKLIQSEQSHQIPTQMQMGKDLGMTLLDQALLAAIAAREIDPDDAYNYAMEKKAFQKYVARARACCRRSISRARMTLPRRLRRLLPETSDMAEIDTYLNEILERRGSDLHFIAGDPPRASALWRPDIAPARKAGAGARQTSALRDHAQACRRALRIEGRCGLRLYLRRQWPLPGQRDAADQRHGGGVPRDSVQGAVDGRAEVAGIRAPDVPRQQRAHPGDWARPARVNRQLSPR